jgi:RNA ligase (TIGR02306 family)
MGEGRCEVVRIQGARKHENADTLSVASVYGYPVIFRTTDFAEGDLAVYVPVDSIVPATERWAFLGEHRRIRAKRLRGVFSMGLLTAAEPGMAEGEDVTDRLGITRYEPPEPLSVGGENEPCPVHLPVYDIEGLRRWPDVLTPGEPVEITEKIHGANGRFVWHDGRLYVGSRTCIKRESETSIWWKAARQCHLADKLATHPDLVLYGEVYGQVQDLKYGVTAGVRLAVFDVFDLGSGRWFDVPDVVALCADIDVPCVPQLYVGPWDPALAATYCEGRSALADHVREGFVVKPLTTRYDDRIGRVILKRHGEGYLTRKGG